MSGPSRPTFGTALPCCARCTVAAKLLRPMRMGGIGHASWSAGNDGFWGRCAFLGVDVFE